MNNTAEEGAQSSGPPANPRGYTKREVQKRLYMALHNHSRKRRSQHKVDLPTKRHRKGDKNYPPRPPRRDNRKSRYDADYTGDDERNNKELEAYYRAQNIVPEDEFEEFLQCLATPLPTSFRVTANGKFSRTIQERLKGEMTDLFHEVAKESKKHDEIKPPSQLPWYPDGMAWTVSAPRQMLRRDNALSPFHKFLIQMNDIGAINRQEAVSMIPPLVLNVRRGDTVIDLCAAPGSKTAQILDELAILPGPRESLTDNGVVIANDANIKRCWMLSHQLKRFASPDLVVTHHEAQNFPKIMEFDRVLCDVPCTGDGTLRKAPDIWRRWSSSLGIGIHRLQRQILERGIDILKPGGRLVYSTCSMNPVENEAVVAHALRKYGRKLELLDVSDMLPGLKRRAGLKKWMVKDNSTNVPVSDAEVEDKTETEGTGEEAESTTDSARPVGWFTDFEQVPLRRQMKIVRSLFPPSAEEYASGCFPLERCIRLVPHDQDTGAFFVSVFVKKELTAEELKEEEERLAGKAERTRKYMEEEAARRKEGSPGEAWDGNEKGAKTEERIDQSPGETKQEDVKVEERIDQPLGETKQEDVKVEERIDQPLGETKQEDVKAEERIDQPLGETKQEDAKIEERIDQPLGETKQEDVKVEERIDQPLGETKQEDVKAEERIDQPLGETKEADVEEMDDGGDDKEGGAIIFTEDPLEGVDLDQGTLSRMIQFLQKEKKQEDVGSKPVPVQALEVLKNVDGETLKKLVRYLRKEESTGGRGTRLITEDPLIGLEKLNKESLMELAEFFGLKVGECEACFMTRGSNADGFRRVMVVSPTVRSLLRRSLGSPELEAGIAVKQRLRVVNAGVRVLERTDRKDGECKFRIIYDGLQLMRGSMSKRIVKVGKRDFTKLICENKVKIDKWEEDGRVELNKMASGSAVLVLEQGEEGEEMVVIWKGRSSVDVVMPHEQVDRLGERLGVART